MRGKKGKKQKLTDEEKAVLEEKRQEKLQQEHERKEKEKYDKYITELRQQNYRAALLAEVLKSIEAMRRAYNKLRRIQLEVQSWNEYLSCTSLPNVNDPPAVRKFIYRWKREILEDIKNNFSWVLDADEKTMLSQDFRQKNLCFWNLSKQQPVIGNLYISRIDQCLVLLTELELKLHRSSEPALKDIKTELRTQLSDVLDQFTFRVLTNVERDMSRIDARTAKLGFKSDIFNSSFWTTRPVPQISPKWRTIGYTEIDFPEIDAIILVNNSIETDGFSFKALLMHYDHFSDMASSYNLNIKLPPTPDLRTANDMEWKKREEIMQAKLNQMKADRVKWEQKEAERLAKDEDNKKKKKGVKEKPTKKSKTPRKTKGEPMIVTERTVVDVTEDYLKYETDLFTQQQNSISPESLHLTENEINLRKYRIVGGVYAIHYLIRPEQCIELKSQFLYKVEQPFLKLANFVATNDLDLIEVRINLSNNVNWWLAPVVCYWQPWEESEEFLSLSPELQDFHKNYLMYMKKLENLLFSEPKPKLNYNLVKRLNDFNLNTLPQDIDFQQLISEYIQPRMPITYKFQVEIDALKEILRKEAMHKKEVEMEKTETNIKRRLAFDTEMKKYLVEVQDKIDKIVTKMKSDFEKYCVEQRQRLINLGENELQITRFLMHKTEAHERKMREVDIDEMVKYRDYVDEAFKNKVLKFENSQEVTVEKTHTHVTKTSPRALYLKKPRQMPLKVVNGETVYNFDVPNENNASCYDGDIDDHMLLSTFLRYLIFLFETNKPIFKVKPPVEVKENTLTEEVVLQTPKVVPKSSVTKTKQTVDTGKKGKGEKVKGKAKTKKPAKKNVKKPKSPKKTGKKPKSPKKSKKSPKSKKIPIAIEVESKSPETDKIEETPRLNIKKACKDKILHLVPHFPGKWVRSGITELDFDFDTREVKFQISRFGTFGFALLNYCNFPLNYWELYPNAAKKHSVMLKVIGKYAEIKIEITEDGYSIERIVPNNINFVPNKAVIEYRDLKKFMQNCGFNIFPEDDAGFYITDISEKHRPMEDHTYYCIAQFPLSHYFRMSSFNRVSDRRISVFELYEKLDNVNIPEKFTEIYVSPQKCNTVEISKKTPKTGEPYIDYKMVPEVQEFYPDVYNLIKTNCNELSLRYHDQMKHVHRYNVARLLCSIRPLSFG